MKLIEVTLSQVVVWDGHYFGRPKIKHVIAKGLILPNIKMESHLLKQSF